MVATEQPTKIIQSRGTAFTLIREPRGGKGLPGLAAVSVTKRSSWPTARSGSVGFHEMAAAVLLPAGLVVLVAEGLLLAEADDVQAVGRNAQRNEVLLDGGGAAIAKAQVVFRGATLVAVAFDGCFNRWVPLQEVRSRGESDASVGTNVGLVVVEIGIAHFSQEEFVFRGPLWRRRRRRRVHRDGCSGAGGAAGTRGSNRVGRRVGRRDLGRTLGSDVADIGCDGELRGIGGIPAQVRGFTFVDGSRAGLQRHRGTRGRRRRCGRRRLGLRRLLTTESEYSSGKHHV